MAKQILANYDDEGIYVYQAYNKKIADEALCLGTFGSSFKTDRMTWIKPSFGWMLYRSGYATKPDQEVILKIKLSHKGFLSILEQSVPSNFNAVLFETTESWETALKSSNVRIQWDPDRDLKIERMERRAIQIGLRLDAVKDYISKWIISIEDVTQLANAVNKAIAEQVPFPAVPRECVYEVDSKLELRLGLT